GLRRAGHPHDDVVVAAARDRLVVAFYCAEQHQIGSDETRVYLHLMSRKRDDELFGARRAAEAEDEQKRCYEAPHLTSRSRDDEPSRVRPAAGSDRRRSAGPP